MSITHSSWGWGATAGLSDSHVTASLHQRPLVSALAVRFASFPGGVFEGGDRFPGPEEAGPGMAALCCWYQRLRAPHQTYKTLGSCRTSEEGGALGLVTCAFCT